ncbi:hypothetical protein V6N13_035760 [Hibiscus sabdariffa]
MVFCSLNAKRKVALMVTLWAVWHARNKRVHEGSVATVHGTLSFIAAFICENAVVCSPLSQGVLDEPVSWQAPTAGVIKFNFDSAYDISSKNSISGVIARDSAGLIMASCIVPHHHVADAFVAEALACYQATTFAKELGFKRVVFEGDSLTVVKKVCSSTLDGSLISPIVFDIRAVAREFDGIGFQFVHRTGNNVAHAFARFGRGQQESSYWIEEAPPEAVAAAKLDLEKLVHL